MQDSERFDDIRPYYDSETRTVLDGLIAEPEFIDVIALMRLPRIAKIFPIPARWLVRRGLKKLFGGINCVKDLQLLVKIGMTHLLEKTDSKVTVSGLEHLKHGKPYLFISNHRDIAMDPAYLNFALNQNGFETVRIAIGDNLLSKPYISDLIRVNKSFVVKRSVSGKRAKLEALKTLSEYIRLSITEDKSCVWIAQREGRAKDGRDKTEPALLKMLGLSKEKEQTFQQGLTELNVIPVAISYEFDPCDIDKATELYALRTEGKYTKKLHEDLASIHKGIVGYKGHIHLTFGEPINDDFSDADQLAELMDQSIIGNYYLHITNILAYEMLEGADDYSKACRQALGETNWVEQTERFTRRINSYDPRYQPIVLDSYANPLRAKKYRTHAQTGT